MKRVTIAAGIFLFFLTVIVPPSFASQYDLKKMTPEIEAALKNRQGRFSELQKLKRTGSVGENNQGYVTALEGEQALVSRENSDREVIYRGLVTQNSLGPNGMREVQQAFAEVQREKAGPGEMVQTPSGEWVRKAA